MINYIKRELQIFFTCVMFYTRIPVPNIIDHSDEFLNKATKYFPLIGWIAGGVAAGVYYAAQFVLPLPVAILLSMIATIFLTGAFHEDGFADVCDGFGGGWTKEKILEIMKDSRIGTYGTVGLVLILLMKFLLLFSIEITILPFVMIFANTLSRFAAVIIIYTHQYARADELSKVKPIGKKISTFELLLAILWTIIPFFFLKNFVFALIVIPVLLVTFYLARYFTKWLGGYTGDCLGATQQINEIVIYLTFLVIWKFI